MPGEVRQRRPQAVNKTGDIRQSQIDKEGNVSKGWVLPFITAFVVTCVGLVLLFIMIPSPINPESYEVSEPMEFTDVMKISSDALKYAERLHEGVLHGPESVVVDGDYVYTGCSDGWVKVIHKGEVRNLVTFGREPCGGVENENTCGRPLGMRMDKDGFLVVADAYYGLFRVNVATGDYVQLFSTATPVDGKPVKLPNDLDIGPDGKIYFSHTSTSFNRNQLHYLVMECGTDGRLLMYDPQTEAVTVLVDGLRFANGVQMSKDKSAVLVAETIGARVWKYDLTTGKKSIWADNFPCIVDNIRYLKSSGTYWAGCAAVRKKGKFLIDMLAPYPWLRAQLAKLATYRVYVWLQQLIRTMNPGTMAVELDDSGKIIKIMLDTSGTGLEGVSEVEGGDGVLYFGSYHSSYLGRLYTNRIPKH